jgi:hypothetical protein
MFKTEAQYDELSNLLLEMIAYVQHMQYEWRNEVNNKNRDFIMEMNEKLQYLLKDL